MKIFNIFVLVLFGITTSYSQVRLNEIVSKNNTSLDINGATPDWIELYNEGTSAINLEGYQLSDDEDLPAKWIFPSVTIPANGYLLVLADSEDILDEYVHTNFKLSGSGETLIFSRPDGSEIEDEKFPSLEDDISYSLIQGEWLLATPSPDASNEGKALPFLPTPEFNINTGIYIGNTQVIITSSEPTAEIEFYINDLKGLTKSETPDTSLTLTTTAIICARADSPFFQQSEFNCHTYVINMEHSLPVISVIADNEGLFDPVDGLFELGEDADTEWPFLGANYWSDGSEEVYFQYFNDGEMAPFYGHADLQMHGGRQARTNPQKTFRLEAKTKYDQPFFIYPFFESKPLVESFKRLVIRNASGDYNVAHCRDGFLQDHLLQSGLNIDGVAYQPIAVYINGSYYGLMGLREKTDKYYMESNYGTTDIDLLEEEKVATEGDELTFEEHIQYILSSDLSNETSFEQAATYFDVPSLVDYFVAQIGHNNFDWPLNNIKYWRERKPGAKWRYLLFDMDASLGRFSWTQADDDILGPKLELPAGESIFIALMKEFLENDSFKNLVLNRNQDLFNTALSTGSMQSSLDNLVAKIDSEIQTHFQKWPSQTYVDWKMVEIENLKSYMTQRPELVAQEYVNYFNLSGTYELELFSDENDIRFDLNTLVDIENDFNGIYFKGIPIRIKANSMPNKEFSHWEIDEDGELSIDENEILERAFSKNVKVKAVYDGSTSTLNFVKSYVLQKDNMTFTLGTNSISPVVYQVLDIDGKVLASGLEFVNSNPFELKIPFQKKSNSMKVVHLSQGSKNYSLKIVGLK